MGRMIPAFLLLILSACAGMSAGGGGAKTEGIRTLGIVSAIGDKFYLRKVGVTVFGNESQEMAIEPWGIDDLVTAKLRAALTPRYDVRPVTYRRAAFAALPGTEIIRTEHRPDLVRTEVSPQGLDAYLVVTKSEDQFGQTNQILRGLGMVQAGGLIRSNPQLHAYYVLGIVDGHALTLSGDASANLTINVDYGTRLGPVTREVEESLWPTSLNAASNPRLKAAVVDLIDKSLPGTLQRVHLLQ
jgi:hypothetical protein